MQTRGELARRPGHRALKVLRPCVAVLLAGLMLSTTAWAHPALMDTLRHSVEVRVGPEDTDIEVEITFHELRSMAERRRMDADRDRTISPKELSAYARGLEESLTDQLGLQVDGNAVPVIPLYRPEVDLLETPQVVPARHVLRLFYFARTPVDFRPGSELVLSSALWAEAPAVCLFSAEGKEGARLAATGTDSTALSPGSTGRRELRARCIDQPTDWRANVPARAVNSEAPPRQAAQALQPIIPTDPDYPIWPVLAVALGLSGVGIGFRIRRTRQSRTLTNA
ncbi:MAG: hypothetical protein AMXMBFR13_06620 [Phycisphaerae bacterium]